MLQANGGDRSRRRRIHPVIAPIAAKDSQAGFSHLADRRDRGGDPASGLTPVMHDALGLAT
jgi:hypothetical protein